MTRSGTMREEWIEILRLCGGRATTKDLARMARVKHLNPELEEKAIDRAYQASARKCLNEFGVDGSPGAVFCQEAILDDDGKEVHVNTWVQSDVCTQGEWEFTICSRMSGIRGDAKKMRQLRDWGFEKWPRTSKRAFRRIERQFGFSVDDVAGPEDDSEPAPE